MDLNIDNYNDNEIYNLFKLNKRDCNIDNLSEVILYNKNLISNSQLDNKINILKFLNKCFIRLSNDNNFDISNTIKTKLDLHEFNTLPTIPIEIPQKLSINSSNTLFPAGTVNPLKKEITTSMLIINSKFRENTNNLFINSDKSGTNGLSTDFTIELVESYNNVVSLKLASLELINSYYPVSEYLKTNQFTITSFEYEIANPSNIINSTSNIILLDDGSYTSSDITAAIQNIFNNSPSNSLNAVIINYNSLTGKINFYINTTPSTPPTIGYAYGFHLDFTIQDKFIRPSYLNFGWLLGFKKLYYNFFDNYIDTSSNTLNIGFNSESPLNLLGSSFYLIEIDDYNNNHSKVINYNINSPYSFNINNIIAKIPNASETNSLFFEDSSDKIFKKREYFGPVRIKKLRIRLLDENGFLLNLNDSEVVISLEIKTINNSYKKMVY